MSSYLNGKRFFSIKLHFEVVKGEEVILHDRTTIKAKAPQTTD